MVMGDGVGLWMEKARVSEGVGEMEVVTAVRERARREVGRNQLMDMLCGSCTRQPVGIETVRPGSIVTVDEV